MPRKPQGLRAVRESARRDVKIPVIAPIAYRIGDGTHGFAGDRHVARDRDEGRRWWPHYRRVVWALTGIGQLPHAAELFDGLSTAGADRLRETWQWQRFDLPSVLDAVATDRQAVRLFRAGDPQGAETIDDFLALFLDGLDSVETEARRIGASTAPYFNRGAPQIHRGGRYGGHPVTHAPGIARV